MVFLEVLVIVLFVAVVYLALKNLRWKISFEQKISDWKWKEEERIRRDAATRSGRTLSGKTLEKLVPFLDEFDYDPHDVRWLGDPIDLVVFDGLSAGKNPEQIVFVEVKSNESKLSPTQNKIKELIEGKKVKWDEFRI